jgi:hypothetical protein
MSPYIKKKLQKRKEKWSLHSFLTTVPQQVDMAGNILLFFLFCFYKKIKKYYQPHQLVVELLWDMSVVIISQIISLSQKKMQVMFFAQLLHNFCTTLTTFFFFFFNDQPFDLFSYMWVLNIQGEWFLHSQCTIGVLYQNIMEWGLMCGPHFIVSWCSTHVVHCE